MGNLYDYFAAPDDDSAAATHDEGVEAAGFEVVDLKGIDPIVQMGTLTALLCDVTYDEAVADPRHGHLLTDPAAESCWVVTLTEVLRDGLADATSERLASVAEPWSRTEEFFGQADGAVLAECLGELADLARRARSRNQGLYCWISL